MITFSMEETQRIVEIEKFLRFVHPFSLIEVRALGDKDGDGITRHLNTSHRLLAYSAIMADRTGAPVYFGVNQVSASSAYALLNTTERPLRNVVNTAKDRDIVSRSIHLIDVDSIQPKGVCATEAEKAEALAVSSRVVAFLRQRDWPETVIVDSGNGYQLLYRGQYGNPDSPAWAYVLRLLAHAFDTPGAKIDPVVFNPARIARMPYTWNRKGESTAERPHRLATVVSFPEKWIMVNHGSLIHRYAEENGYVINSPEARRGGSSSRIRAELPELVDDPEEAIEQFIADYPEHLDCAGTFEKDGKTLYALRECPFARRAHTGALGKTTIILGADFVGFSCFSDDCFDYTMTDLRELLHEKTGRSSRAHFYKPQPLDVDKYADRWGGIDDYTQGASANRKPSQHSTFTATAAPAVLVADT